MGLWKYFSATCGTILFLKKIPLIDALPFWKISWCFGNLLQLPKIVSFQIKEDKGGYYNIPSVPCALLGGQNVSWLTCPVFSKIWPCDFSFVLCRCLSVVCMVRRFWIIHFGNQRMSRLRTETEIHSIIL